MKEISAADLRTATQNFPPMSERDFCLMYFTDYYPRLLAAGILIDRTNEYKKTFCRCIPYHSALHSNQLCNVISMLVEDTRVPGKLWHVLGGLCSITFTEWGNDEPARYSYWECAHAGCARSPYEDGKGYTRAMIRAKMLKSGLGVDFVEKSLARLRPVFPPGVYTKVQLEPNETKANRDYIKKVLEKRVVMPPKSAVKASPEIVVSL